MYPFVQSQRSSARLPRLLGFAGYEEFAVLCRNFETGRPNARPGDASAQTDPQASRANLG